VLANKGKDVKAGIMDSMKGADGVAPWMKKGGSSGGGGNMGSVGSGQGASEEERTLIGYEFLSPKVSRNQRGGDGNGTLSMMLSSHFSIFRVDSTLDAGKDMKLLRFKCLPSLRSSLAFRGRHVDVKANVKYFYETNETAKEFEEEDDITRPYTPIVRPDEYGEFTLLVKGYEKGMLSKHLVNMQVGDCIEMRGPRGGVDVQWLDLNEQEKRNNSGNSGGGIRLVLLGAGTGVTPCLQLIYGVLANLKRTSASSTATPPPPQTVSEIILLTFNRNEQDIPMREELDSLPMLSPPVTTSTQVQPHLPIKVYHVLSKPPDAWDGLKGHVTKEMIRQLVSTSSSDQGVKENETTTTSSSSPQLSSAPTTIGGVRLGFCGPDGFHETTRKIISSLNIDSSCCHEFC
jgi:NAD(P)H-flavin reductase